MRERLVELYRQRFGSDPESVLEMAGDGSTRRYHRLRGPDGRTVIGGVGPDRDENRAFLSYSRALRGAGLPVPDIYAADETAGVWLEEDLGDVTLFDALEEARAAGEGAFPPAIEETYRRVLSWLPRFQVEGHRVVDYSVAYPRAAFDRQSILWDLNYFKYHFLKLAHISFNEALLERDFGRFAAFLLRADTGFFLYRDFQSRNVMLRGEEPWFIDYQGGRRGALAYDVASLLYDAKADLPEEARNELLRHYLDALAPLAPVDPKAFEPQYRAYVLVRILQALGAYGYRGFFERKPRFLRSVPYAARNLERLLARGLPLRLPEIEAVLERIVDRFGREERTSGGSGRLTVRVESFSYRRGYPRDATGHGGGFVFDCRALPNPGRRAEFADATGRDATVRAWLEEEPAVEAFYEHARALVGAQVATYAERGFTDLTVAFGCTGGQHRSVYFAERLVGDLRAETGPLEVRLHHREEPYWPEEPAGMRGRGGSA